MSYELFGVILKIRGNGSSFFKLVGVIKNIKFI